MMCYYFKRLLNIHNIMEYMKLLCENLNGLMFKNNLFSFFNGYYIFVCITYTGNLF